MPPRHERERPDVTSAPSARWTILAVLFATRTVMAFQFQSLPALGPVLVQDLGIDYAVFGTLVGLFLLPGVVFAVPGGVLGQRFGDKRIALIGLGLMALGGLLIAFASSVPLAAAGRLCSGVGGVLLNIILAKMVTDWFAHREIVLAMALFVSSWPFGIGLALLVLPSLASTAGTSVALGLTCVLSIVALIALAAVYRVPVGYVAAPPTFRLQLNGREWALSVLSGLVWGLYNVGFILVLVFGPSFLASRGMPIATAGATASIATWTILVSLPLGGYLAQRVNSPNLVMAGCFVVLALCAAALGAGAWPALVCALFGLIAGPPPGLIMALPGSALRPENRAAGMGIYYACSYAAMAGLVPVAGFLRDATESPSAPLYFAAGTMVAAGVALAGFRAVQRQVTSAMPASTG